LDRMSGRWIRDQLRDVVTEEPKGVLPGPAPSQPPSTGDENPFTSIAENLSRAVTEPMVRLSHQHEEERRRLESVIDEQKGRIRALSAAVERMEAQLTRSREASEQQIQALQQTVDSTGADLRRDTQDLSAKATEL